MKNYRIALIFLFTLTFSTTTLAINVGITTLEFSDDQRVAWDGKQQRPIVTHIFYPTNDQHVEQIKLGNPGEEVFIAGNAAWNAKPVAQTQLPLIIMSHGTGGSALQMLWLAEALVKSGYLVVGVNHHGNTAIEPKKYAEGFMLWWERSQDIAVTLTLLSNNTTWAPYINQSQIGVVGFSLGGYTAISAIGGITDRSPFAKFCSSEQRDSTCDDQVEFPNIAAEFDKVKNTDSVKASLQRQHNSYQVDAIKAAFILAPAAVQSFTTDSLKDISIPVSLAVGTKDAVTPAKSNAKRIASLVSGAYYNEIENAAHYTFLSECTAQGKQYLKALCHDDSTIDRHKAHSQVSEKAVNFFDAVFENRKK